MMQWSGVLRRAVVTLGLASVAAGAGLTAAPLSGADDVAYLVNVTVRPDYGFSNAADALAYGRRVCAKIVDGHPYGELVRDAKADFTTSDEFQASYLIAQAVNELCPAQIWTLRQSAAGYRLSS